MQPDTSSHSAIWLIKGRLIAALSALTCVRRIDSFGSVAVCGSDEWSDLDLIVSCELPERTSRLAASAIRSMERVAFYRMFTRVPQPSGRYWFGGESPFHRLDVSFYSTAAHAVVTQSGFRYGHPISCRAEYVAHLPPDPSADSQLHTMAAPARVTPLEDAIGRLLYVHLETAKRQLRGHVRISWTP